MGQCTLKIKVQLSQKDDIICKQPSQVVNTLLRVHFEILSKSVTNWGKLSKEVYSNKIMIQAPPKHMYTVFSLLKIYKSHVLR